MKKIIIIILLIPTWIFAQTLGTVTTKTVKVPTASLSVADALPAKDFLKEKLIYDDVREETSFPINEVGKADNWSWRLIHDGKTVIDFNYSNGVTGTIYNVFEGTFEDCNKKIEELKLEITDEKKRMADAQFNRLNK